MTSVAQIVAELLPMLQARSIAELEHWTEAELYEYADEAAQSLARATIAFVEHDTSTLTLAGSASYRLPDRYLGMLHVALSGAALRRAPVREIEALDAQWPTASGPVSHYILDELGLDSFRLYKIPATGGAVLALVYASRPETISAAHATLAAPSPLADLLRLAILREARGREGDAAMPEVAVNIREFERILTAAAVEYWS